MNKNKTLVSVVMPVYNAGNYLEASLQSILNQTYKEFEFIIVDDASSDNSWKILRKFSKKDSRIKLFRNPINFGVSASVKRAISNSKGDFIARMDADDISIPQRIEKQLEYLKKHKKTVAIGGQCSIIDRDGKITGEKIFPLKFKDIYRYIYRFVPLQQPTLMIAKKRLPSDFKFYQDGMNTAEEVELLFKLFTYGKVENIPDRILFYRIHDKNTSLKNLRETFFLTLIARIKAVFKYNYKPDFTGILITFLQATLILLLPKRLVFALYKITRKTSNLKITSPALSRLPIFSR